MKKLALHWQVIIGLLLGVVYAWLSVTMGWNDFTLAYIQPFGDIFINLLKLIAVPLVLFSIISGVTSLGNIQKLGRMGIKTLLTYVATTMAAVVIGLALVNVFQPDRGPTTTCSKPTASAMNSGATPTASKRWTTFAPSMTRRMRRWFRASRARKPLRVNG